MKNENVLITGGGGFLGQGLARALVDDHVVTVTTRDAGRSGALAAETGANVVAVDITDIAAVRRAFAEVEPDVVIHCASMKSVADAETNPIESSEVNVIGSQNIARVALERGCRAVVGISSSRATPPTGDTYGLTKAIMERMFCSLNEKSDTRFTAVRLGNIAWSPGSVLPAWQQMLDDSGLIGTTGPEMRRFFLTLDEAVATVVSVLDRVDEYQGRVVAPKMKQAQISDVLAAFVEARGGDWQQIEGRIADKRDEVLVGDLELPYCREVDVEGAARYVLSFNESAAEPLAAEVTTENADALSADEIAALVATGGGM